MMPADPSRLPPPHAPPLVLTGSRWERPRRITLGGVLIVLFCLGAVATGQLIAHARTDDADRWQYAYVGQRILAGDAIYSDVWDVKPPLHYWLNTMGLWMASGKYAGVTASCAIVTLLSVVMLYAACRAFAAPRAAGVSAAIGAVFFSHAYFFGGSNRSETSEVLCSLAAIAMYAHFRRTRRWWIALGAGIAAGVAIGAKQSATALLIALVLDGIARIVFAHESRGRSVGALVAVLIGACAGGFAWLWPALAAAGWPVVYDALVGFHHLHVHSLGQSILRPDVMPLRPVLSILCVPLILAGVAVVHTVLAVTARSSDETKPDVSARLVPLLSIWWLLGVWQVSIAPHEHTHYWVPTLAPLILLAGITVHRMAGDCTFVECARRRPGVLVAAIALAILAWPAVRIQRDQTLKAWADLGEAADASIAERMAASDDVKHAPPGSVLVWGYAPEIYWRLGRPPACRFVGTHYFFLPDGAAQRLFDEMIAQLNAAPPVLILLDRRIDALAEDTRSIGLDASAFFELISEYDVRATVDGVTIYRRRTPQSSSV